MPLPVITILTPVAIQTYPSLYSYHTCRALVFLACIALTAVEICALAAVRTLYHVQAKAYDYVHSEISSRGRMLPAAVCAQPRLVVVVLHVEAAGRRCFDAREIDGAALHQWKTNTTIALSPVSFITFIELVEG